MSISLKSETVSLCEKISEDFSQTLVEGDIIVPDIKPDIKNILQVDGYSVVTKKEILQDKVNVYGTLFLNVLYVAENSSCAVSSIRPEINFHFVSDALVKSNDSSILAEFDVEHIEFNLLNSRKLSVKAVVAVNTKLYSVFNADILTDIESEQDIEIKTKNVDICSVVSDCENDFTIRETLEVPAGKPSIGEVLKIDAKIIPKDTKPITNKIVAKGELSVCCLYSSYDASSINFMEYELPFTEVLDAENVEDSCDIDVNYFVKSLDFRVREDSDGDTVYLDIEACVGSNSKATSNVSLNMVEDLFAPDFETEIVKKRVNLEQVAFKETYSVNFKDTAVISDNIPKISQVYNVITKPFISSSTVKNGKLLVSGVIDTYILYLTDNEQNPIYSFKKEVPFSESLDIKTDCEDLAFDVSACVSHSSYNLQNSDEIDIRYIVLINVKASKPLILEYASDVLQGNKLLVSENLPSIIIYFVQKDDSLWNIAKSYGVSIDSIMQANDLLKDSEIKAGMHLLIPKRSAG